MIRTVFLILVGCVVASIAIRHAAPSTRHGWIPLSLVWAAGATLIVRRALGGR